MIEIKGLTKRFDKVVAVNSLNLSVREGTVMGLVGSNGSGKSTLLRMLASFIRTGAMRRTCATARFSR